MNFITWLLGLATFMTLSWQALNFHKATVCRQEAWLKSTELKTRTLLHGSPFHDREFALNCHLVLTQERNVIWWQRLPGFKKHSFMLMLKGKL